MSVWDKTTPSGSDPKSQGDDRLREIKAALEEALQGQTSEGDEAIFPGSSPSTAPVFRYRGLKGATGSRPTAGQYGLYFDTTRNALQRDNGASWDDIGTVIPSGTVMGFFQATVPTGWTLVTTQNDKVLRVVSGTGGGSGGTIATSADLTHSVGSHTHTISHRHTTPVGAVNGNTIYMADNSVWSEGTESVNVTHDASSAASSPGSVNLMKTKLPDTSDSGSATPSVTSHGVLAYADIILGSKD